MSRQTSQSGDRLAVSLAALLDDLSSFTYAAWVYLCGNGGLGTFTPRVFSKADDGGVEHKRVAINVLARTFSAMVMRPDGAAFVQAVNDSLTLETWLHLAITYNEAGGLHLYRDGVELNYAMWQPGGGATSPDAGGEFTMLNIAAANAAMDGRLAEVGIWNRVLNGTELSRLAAARWTPRLLGQGLLATWRLLGIQTPEPEAVHGYAATVAGPVAAEHPAGIVTGMSGGAMLVSTMRGTLCGTM